MLRGRIAIPAILLVVCSVAFGVSLRRVAAEREAAARNALNHQWAALKSHLRIERDTCYWYYDPDDPDQAWIVSRIRERFLLADESGRILVQSVDREGMRMTKPAEIKAAGNTDWKTQRDARGTSYLVRSGIMLDTQRQSSYHASIAVPIRDGEGLPLLPVVFACGIACSLSLGWVLGRTAPARV